MGKVAPYLTYLPYYSRWGPRSRNKTRIAEEQILHSSILGCTNDRYFYRSPLNPSSVSASHLSIHLLVTVPPALVPLVLVPSVLVLLVLVLRPVLHPRQEGGLGAACGSMPVSLRPSVSAGRSKARLPTPLGESAKHPNYLCQHRHRRCLPGTFLVFVVCTRTAVSNLDARVVYQTYKTR